jgi:hypothetical protein
MATPTATPTSPLNDPHAPRPDIPVGDMSYPEGDLPEQMGGAFVNLFPGIDLFKLPVNIQQLWDEIVMEDQNPKSKTYKQQVRRLRLRFNRDNPLVIVGGAHEGETMTATLTSSPRPRGKKTDPTTAWVSDLAYLLEVSLKDGSRPANPELLKAAINRYAGRMVRLEHGLSAQCREDKVRYVLQTIDGVERAAPDPNETKGCGMRYYTKDFKDSEAKPGEPQYSDQIECDCGALLRGFPSVDRFLAPAK